MNITTLYRVAVLGLTWLAGSPGHDTGDYLVQLDCDAQRKQQRTPAGRRSLAVLTREVGDAAGGWFASERGVAAMVIAGVQPAR